MSLNEEYNAITFVKNLLKSDEILHKSNGTETFDRSCQRKAIEYILDSRKQEIEQIYAQYVREIKDIEDKNDRK